MPSAASTASRSWLAREGDGQRAHRGPRLQSAAAKGQLRTLHRRRRKDRRGRRHPNSRRLSRRPQGAGSVHHVAFRAADDAAQAEWQRRSGRRASPTDQINRRYFRSVYFREPGGVLFEIATDDPGSPWMSRKSGSATRSSCRPGTSPSAPRSWRRCRRSRDSRRSYRFAGGLTGYSCHSRPMHHLFVLPMTACTRKVLDSRVAMGANHWPRPRRNDYITAPIAIGSPRDGGE